MAKEEIFPPEPETLFRINPNPPIPILPQFKEKQVFDLRYPLIEPFAYAHIYFDPQSNELV